MARPIKRVYAPHTEAERRDYGVELAATLRSLRATAGRAVGAWENEWQSESRRAELIQQMILLVSDLNRSAQEYLLHWEPQGARASWIAKRDANKK